jgi:hypothetical protein
VLLALTGCDKRPASPPAPMARMAAPAAPMSAAMAQPAAKLAYSHDLHLEMPRDSIKPRYERAIKECLDNAKLNCLVLHSSISMGDPTGIASPSATLTVRLAHDAVAPFEDDLLAPLPGEQAGDAILLSRSTNADDLTAAIADVEQRQAQLTDYRDRLRELAKRPDVKVEDLIKIEGEISNTQSQLEQIAAQQKALNQRVDSESLTVYLGTRGKLGGIADPIVLAWHQTSRVLGDSTATAIEFIAAALPWLPIAALGLLFIRLGLRRWRR